MQHLCKKPGEKLADQQFKLINKKPVKRDTSKLK